MNLVTRLIEATSGKRKTIVVVGDVMVDHWVHGYVASCQDGCDKFVRESYLKTPGGAGNAYRCLDEWNVRPLLFGQSADYTPNKWRFVDEHDAVVFRYDDEQRPPIYNRGDVLSVVKVADAVLLSDYDKGFLTPELTTDIIAMCRKRCIPCVADAKRKREFYEGATLKANFEWFRYNGACDVITHGGEPPAVIGKILTNRLPPVRCLNHVGAGDCFAAHMILGLVYGFSLAESATIAHSAGRVYVQHPHNRPPQPSEIESDLA